MKWIPPWRETPPKQESYRSIFKWGARAFFRHPNPRLTNLLLERLHIDPESFRKRKNEGDGLVRLPAKSRLSQDQILFFERVVGKENLSERGYDLVRFAHGQTVEEIFLLRSERVEASADLVIHPKNKHDIEEICRFCHQEKIPVYVFGGGTSVNFGFKCEKGGVVLVLRTHMNRILGFNEVNQTIDVEPGIDGPTLESALREAPERFAAKRRYTCGHFPQSFEYSTVGGWISAFGSGQESSYYGDMKDIVISQEYVTPVGIIQTEDHPATAVGPSMNAILVGSEGVFGVLVRARLKIFRYNPKHRKRFAFMFPSWKQAVNAAKEISQGEFGMPAVLRISDPEETDIALKLYGLDNKILDRSFSRMGYRPMERALCIGSAVGEREFAKLVAGKAKKVCRRHRGFPLSGYPVKRWEHGRFTDPYLRDDLHDFGIVIDTLESSVTWDHLHGLHEEVRKEIKNRPDTICMAHSSHFYPQGTNLYFIFITKIDDVEDYKRFQGRIIDAIIRGRGSLSHHHGIGKMLAPWMEKYVGITHLSALRALKNHFDPGNIMNPGGTLGLDLREKSLTE